jgi:hypothetical protein
MGRTPAATPTSEKQKEYANKAGERHGKGKSQVNCTDPAINDLTVEISEPGQPTFLPSVSGRPPVDDLSVLLVFKAQDNVSHCTRLYS